MSDTAAGAATDSQGRAVLDPTKNVLDLVEAAIKRQDDLREMEALHVREMAALRSAHAKELRKAETDRLDAIRANDQSAVQRAADVAQTALNALASQGTEQAETLRTQVENRAVTQEARLLAALDPIQKDIADLRRVQYEAVGGKTQVTETQAVGAGRVNWLGIVVAVAAIAVTLMLSVAGLIVTLLLRG